MSENAREPVRLQERVSAPGQCLSIPSLGHLDADSGPRTSADPVSSLSGMRRFRRRIAITFASLGGLRRIRRLRLRGRNRRPRAKGFAVWLLVREHPVRRFGQMAGDGRNGFLMVLTPRDALVELADMAAATRAGAGDRWRWRPQ
jgi:hypothetical protein